MNEATRKKVLMVIAVVAVIWGISNFTGDSPKTSSQPDSSDAYIPLSAVTAEPKSTQLEIDIDSVRSMPWHGDPFRAHVRPSNQGAAGHEVEQVWTVSGIVYSATKPMAIINARPVVVGDVVDNARVLEIQRNAVVIEGAGQRIELTVSKG